MINKFEYDYKKLLSTVWNEGDLKPSRAGTVKSAFNMSMTINPVLDAPILTGRKIFWQKAYHEYIWIKEGLTTTTYLKQNGIHWWDDFADKNGNLGKTYGYQFRNFNGEIDQLDYINRTVRQDKFSRRLHATLWNPSELNETKLPPCYTGITFNLNGRGTLDMAVQLISILFYANGSLFL